MYVQLNSQTEPFPKIVLFPVALSFYFRIPIKWDESKKVLVSRLEFLNPISDLLGFLIIFRKKFIKKTFHLINVTNRPIYE